MARKGGVYLNTGGLRRRSFFLPPRWLWLPQKTTAARVEKTTSCWAVLSPEMYSTGGGKNGREEGTHRKNGLEVAGSREQPPEKRRTPAVVSCCSHPLGKTPEEGRAPEKRWVGAGAVASKRSSRGLGFRDRDSIWTKGRSGGVLKINRLMQDFREIAHPTPNFHYFGKKAPLTLKLNHTLNKRLIKSRPDRTDNPINYIISFCLNYDFNY